MFHWPKQSGGDGGDFQAQPSELFDQRVRPHSELPRMKLGFICINALGHLNPMTTLARELQARKHEVIFLYSSEAAGLPVYPGEQVDMQEVIAEVSTVQGLDTMNIGMQRHMAQIELILNSLEATIAQTGVDALLIDTIYYYAELGAINLGIPYIQVSNAMYFDYSGYTPLCIYGWPHENTEAAMARNRAGVEKHVGMLAKHRTGIENYAKRAGLKIDWAHPGSISSPLATSSSLASITQVPRAFDFESAHWPAQFHHTGPFHDGKGRTKVDFPWSKLTGEPLVYASMGTVVNGNPEIFQTIVNALAKLNGLQLVVSIGDQIDPGQIVSVPKNAIIVPRAPQLDLLKLASVCITHAGINTVLESLAQGVPQVAIPIGLDQPGVAARIAHRQTGLVTSFDKLNADHLSELVTEIMDNSTYRTNAQWIERQIIEADGISAAADIIERAFGAETDAKAA
jgi:zeaxanthin glucosyltransferase